MGIKRRFFLFLIVIVLIPFLVGPNSQGYAQTGEEWFCEETGYVVRGEFLNFYYGTEDFLELFGYPITGEISDKMGHRVQYFQKARLDLDEETGLIYPAPLGTYLYSEGEFPVADIEHDNSLCRTFPNGKTVCYAFLQFYDAKNGEKYLGMPISNMEYNHAGYVTQFFEFGALEWNPEKPHGMRVQVADLGRIYHDRFRGYSPYGEPRDFIPGDISLVPQVDVFTSKAIVAANSTEKIFIITKDQYDRPLVNAEVSIIITLPDQTESSFRPANTNEDGITTLEIAIGNLQPQDIIHIKANVSNGIETSSNTTWFRVWW